MATLYDTITNSTDITVIFSGKQTHIDRHINQSPADMLNRVLSQNVSHSAFYDKQTMNNAVKHLMLQEYANLKNWLHNTNQKVFKLSGPESHPVGSGLIHPSFQRNNKLIAV